MCGCGFSKDFAEIEMVFLVILLMEEIPHQLIGSLSHFLQGFIHPRWCRISSINSMNHVSFVFHICYLWILWPINRIYGPPSSSGKLNCIYICIYI